MEEIRQRHAFTLIVIFLLGNSIIYVGNAYYHAWQGIILSFVIFLPVLFIYCFILSRNPNKSFYQIIKENTIPIIAQIIILAYILFAVYIIGKIVFNYYNLVTSTEMFLNHDVILLTTIAFITIVLSKKDLKTIGRFSQFTFFSTIIMIGFFTISSIPKMELSNALPILPYHIEDFKQNIIRYLINPFGETVILLNVLTYTIRTKKTNLIYLLGFLIATVLLSTSVIRAVSVLGDNLIIIAKYPLFLSDGIINIADFISRIESLTIIVFFLTSLVKASICIYSVKTGLNELFKTEGNLFVTPIVIISVLLGIILFSNTLELIQFRETIVIIILSLIIPTYIAIIISTKEIALKHKMGYNKGR